MGKSLVRLGSVWSGLGSALDELEEVFGQFCKDAEQLIDSGPLFDEPSGQAPLEVAKNVGAIDAVMSSGLDIEVLLRGTEYGKGIEVVAKHFGADKFAWSDFEQLKAGPKGEIQGNIS